MRRPSYIVALLATTFVLVLLFTTFKSTPSPLGEDREAIAAATRVCQQAIQESVADARFPFEANVSELQGDQLLLSGSIDSGSGPETERRNYSCYLSIGTGSGPYVADSVEVWKSH